MLIPSMPKKGWSQTASPPHPLSGNLSGRKLPSPCQTWLEETNRFRSHKDSAQANACVYMHKHAPCAHKPGFLRKCY